MAGSRLAGVRQYPARLAGRKLLRAFAAAYPDATFVEIGANDGAQGDHLRRLLPANNRWRGILVEPNPTAFRRLSRNYEGQGRVALENAAIATRDGRLPFYEISPPPEASRPRSSAPMTCSAHSHARLCLPTAGSATSRAGWCAPRSMR